MPVIPALGRWKQKDHEFEASVDYIETLSQENHKTQKLCPEFIMFVAGLVQLNYSASAER
jgi:hypothetical protein